MKRVFLDTNFLMDYLERQQYKPVCEELLEKGALKKIKFYISFLSVANFAYINRKKEKDKLYTGIKILCSLFKVLPNNKEHLFKAMKLNAGDFEDAIQYEVAISNKCDCIITRNGKDFTYSNIPVYTPEEFIETIGN